MLFRSRAFSVFALPCAIGGPLALSAGTDLALGTLVERDHLALAIAAVCNVSHRGVNLAEGGLAAQGVTLLS